jgi:hypothetical protein
MLHRKQGESDMTQTITALFDTYEDASAAVAELEAIGVPHVDISLVANNVDGWYDDRPSNAAEDAGAGAGIGAAVGGVGGLLAGLGIVAIPGVGPVVAAGWLVATAAGAAAGAVAGAAAGGLVGAMTQSGVSESDAHVYAEGVRRGGTLVTARVQDNKLALANEVLARFRRVDVGARGRFYRDSGWSGFDSSAPVYTADEIARERDRSMRV